MTVILWVKHEEGPAGELILDGGRLDGSSILIEYIQNQAAEYEGTVMKVTPVGPFFTAGDMVTDPVAFWMICMATFDSVDVQRDRGEDPRDLLEALMYPEGTDAGTVF